MVASHLRDQWHQRANRSWLPFVVNALAGRPYRAGGCLPLNDPAALTAESVEALRQVLPRAVLSSAARDAGWRQVVWALPGDEHPRRCRLWESPQWQATQLAFSDAACDALVALYNLSAIHTSRPEPPRPAEGRSDAPPARGSDRASRGSSARTAPASEEPPAHSPSDTIVSLDDVADQLDRLTLDHNGDLLIHFYLARRLFYDPGPHQVLRWHWRANPLLGMLLPVFGPPQPADSLPLQRLFAADLASWLPWLFADLGQQWRQSEPWLWNRYPEHWARHCRHRGDAAHGWLLECRRRERYDLLVPLLNYFTGLLRAPANGLADVAQLRGMLGGLALRERQRHLDDWLHLLDVIDLLRDLADNLRRVHPVDRDACQGIYLASYSTLKFPEVHEKYLHLRQQWRPTLT